MRVQDLTAYRAGAKLRAMTGLDLRLARTARRIRSKDLAAAMGVSASRVSHIENADVLHPATVARYLTALEHLTRPGSRRAA